MMNQWRSVEGKLNYHIEGGIIEFVKNLYLNKIYHSETERGAGTHVLHRRNPIGKRVQK